MIPYVYQSLAQGRRGSNDSQRPQEAEPAPNMYILDLHQHECLTRGSSVESIISKF